MVCATSFGLCSGGRAAVSRLAFDAAGADALDRRAAVGLFGAQLVVGAAVEVDVRGVVGAALAAWVAANAHYKVEVVRRPDGATGFVLLPKRWVVERTFAWLKRCRRLTADREKPTRSSEAMVRLAMIRRMLRRLHPAGDEAEFRYRKAA